MVWKYVIIHDGIPIPYSKKFVRLDSQGGGSNSEDDPDLVEFTTPDGAHHIRLAAVSGDTTWQQPDESRAAYDRRLANGWAYESMAAVADRGG